MAFLRCIFQSVCSKVIFPFLHSPLQSNATKHFVETVSFPDITTVKIYLPFSANIFFQSCEYGSIKPFVIGVTISLSKATSTSRYLYTLFGIVLLIESGSSLCEKGSVNDALFILSFPPRSNPDSMRPRHSKAADSIAGRR